MDRKCGNDGQLMQLMGDMKFRSGGYSGASGMFLGGWEELMEKTQTFTLYKCPGCGKVDLYEPGS